MIIQLEVSADCEGTDSPWWMIVDPKQNFKTNHDGAANIAMGMITGPFFSREEATRELESRRYAYGKGAVVWCASGYRATQYHNAIRPARGGQ